MDENTEKSIYDTLKTVEVDEMDITVHRERPDAVEALPALTYEIFNNVPRYGLDKEVKLEATDVAVDIWAKNSTESRKLLVATEAKMRDSGYRLTSHRHLVDPSGISHRATIFTY